MYSCRSCANNRLVDVLSLGVMPLANALVPETAVGQPEKAYPLDLVYCPACSLVQITETVSPEELFREYLYFSSYSETLLRHARALAEKVVDTRGLGAEHLVVEIASNDGYLLQYYKALGVDVLGIEPAKNIATVAVAERGIPTIAEFFNAELARTLHAEGRSADVLHAHNVLAHVADLNGFVEGVSVLLAPTGVAIFEVPYLLDMLDKCEFDTIYHEHLCYFSLTALRALFARHGLDVIDVEMLPVHGGSLRVYVGHADTTSAADAVGKVLEEEGRREISEPALYRDFASKVMALKRELVAMVTRLKAAGNHLAVYGASAKATVLLNYCALGTDVFDYVVDISPHKIGHYLPGVQLPIYHPSKLLETRPDYTLLTVWNIADEIMKQQEEYRKGGGRFIRPVPRVEITQ